MRTVLCTIINEAARALDKKHDLGSILRVDTLPLWLRKLGVRLKDLPRVVEVPEPEPEPERPTVEQRLAALEAKKQ